MKKSFVSDQVCQLTCLFYFQLQTFLRSCGAKTEIIMSMELRRKEDLDFFKRLVEVGFEFEKVPKEKCHPVYSADEIGVFRIRKQKKP